MSGAIPPLPQYAFMAWCSAKAQEQLYLLPSTDKSISFSSWAEVLLNEILDRVNTFI
jgi:hypothetical protein